VPSVLTAAVEGLAALDVDCDDQLMTTERIKNAAAAAAAVAAAAARFCQSDRTVKLHVKLHVKLNVKLTWNLLVRAGSVSMCCRYSSMVVAPIT